MRQFKLQDILWRTLKVKHRDTVFIDSLKELVWHETVGKCWSNQCNIANLMAQYHEKAI